MNKCSCGCDLDIVKKCDNCNFNEGRKQGALEELKKTIKELEDSLEFYECDYGKFEQHVVDKIMEELTEHINKLNKRLKELKGVN